MGMGEGLDYLLYLLGESVSVYYWCCVQVVITRENKTFSGCMKNIFRVSERQGKRGWGGRGVAMLQGARFSIR